MVRLDRIGQLPTSSGSARKVITANQQGETPQTTPGLVPSVGDIFVNPIDEKSWVYSNAGWEMLGAFASVDPQRIEIWGDGQAESGPICHVPQMLFEPANINNTVTNQAFISWFLQKSPWNEGDIIIDTSDPSSPGMIYQLV